MTAFLERIIPNVMDKLPTLWDSILQTLIMVGVAGVVSLVFGLLFGVVLAVTRPGGILQNKIIFNILDKVINLFRAIPFLILILLLFPLSRLIVGTTIGTLGVIIPLTIGTIPFMSRQIETALSELNPGVIEAAQSMGSGPYEIIFRVYLRECIPGLIRAMTMTFVSLVGYTAMVGAVGGGGLGDFAIRYGHQRFQTDVIYVSILFLLLIISLIQGIGNLIIKKVKH